MKTEMKIIKILKTAGAMTAKNLANELSITTMAIRQHMHQLEDKGDIVYEDKKVKRGRPTRYWSLTETANIHFPNGHESLTLMLIDSVKKVYGLQGLDKLITQREKETYISYYEELSQLTTVSNKLHALAKLRSYEGYMASVEKDDDFYWLIENHCSICAAASTCQNFCRSELQLFQNLFKGYAEITRVEHIMQGARRCTYKITPIKIKN